MSDAWNGDVTNAQLCKDFPELLALSLHHYFEKLDTRRQDEIVTGKILVQFSWHYIPSHQAMLDHAHRLQADA